MIVGTGQSQVVSDPREERCCRCGYRSATGSFFRRERAGFTGLWKSYCRGCGPYRPTSAEVLSEASLVLILLGAAGIISKVAIVFGGVLVVLGMMLPGSLVGVLVHEAGHAGVARALGMRVLKVVVGSGPLLGMFRIFEIRVELRRFVGVAGITEFYDPRARPAKWPQALVLLGGAAANVTLAVLGVAAAVWWPAEPVVLLLAIAVVLTQLLIAARNLSLADVRIGWVVMPSDGKLLIRLFKEDNYRGGGVALRALEEGKTLLAAARTEEAWRHYEDACNRFPESGPLLLALVDAMARTGRDHAVVAYFLALQDRLAESKCFDRRSIALVCATVAMSAVLTHESSFHSLARDLARKAVTLLPGAPATEGTMGAVMAWIGNDNGKGMARLIAAVRSAEPQSIDKVDLVRLVATLERGDPQSRRAWQDLMMYLQRIGSW